MGKPLSAPVSQRVELRQNFPNPFNPSTTVEYFLPFSARVRLVVFDILGNEVKEMVNREQEAGFHHASWNGANVGSGLYYCRLEAANPADPSGGTRATIKM